MLRVLGLSQRRIAGAYTLEFGFVGLLASGGRRAAGLAVHNVFVWLLSGLLDAQLPPPGLAGAVRPGRGLTLLLGFGLPPVLQLARVPPLRVMRRDVGNLKASSLLVLAPGAGGFAALLLAVSSDLKLGAIAVGGFAAAIGVFALLAWAAVRLLRRLVPEAGAPRWLLLATRQLAARPAFAVLQVSALAVGLLALVLLVLLRTDLIGAWRQRHAARRAQPLRHQPAARPGRGLQGRRWPKRGVTRYDWYPMIRGRLVAINGSPWHAGQLHRRPRAAPGRARVQPQPRCAAAGAQPAGRRPLDARRSRRRCRSRTAWPDAGREAGRPAALRHRRQPRKAASPACARWTGVRCG
jgi:putative ABC transport system permease protein